MACVLLCLVVLLSFAACDNGDAERLSAELTHSRARAESLSSALERAQARVQRLDELVGDPLVDRARFPDLYGGGPTVTGSFLALPKLGTLRWTCHSRPSYFRIVFEPAGADVRVGYDTPDDSRRARLRPGRTLGASVAPDETVTWTVLYRHKPGFIRAVVEVTPRRSRLGSCFLGDVRLEETAHPFE